MLSNNGENGVGVVVWVGGVGGPRGPGPFTFVYVYLLYTMVKRKSDPCQSVTRTLFH